MADSFEPPGSPLVERGVHRPVTQVFALGGHVEDIRGEQFGDEALVIVVDLPGAVEPADGIAHGGLGFHQHQRQAVDIQHQVGAPFGIAGPEGDLGGGDVLVTIKIFEINQPDGGVRHCSPRRASSGRLAARR